MALNCGNPNCESCFPKPDGTPKWHGWATPDQVREMMFEMTQFLKKHGEWTILKSAKLTSKGTWQFEHMKRSSENASF